ncbi:FHA domain-containing protein [Streptomyces tropicalis]|uniref:FHA domain-containing protein n=1 Tax=Streptomyces tropicalis TaxID=3034234 RepID=A0ABT6A5Z2_9ACTN|nr:FHA domain-containing protein [Streptomyces tropicalis]MDF3300054.1 FHA domain-containing protein [Streptomyces tropicalis]
MRVTGAVVDVSNVCWSDALPPVGRHFPLIERVFLVREAWRRQFGEHTSMTLVADGSLRRQLSPTDQLRLRQLERDGDVQFAPMADPVLLTLAEERGLHVISRDQFTDLRRAFPWIERSPGRFLTWSTDGGTVRLMPSGIRSVSPQAVSRALEGKALKFEQHLDHRDAAHRKILGHHWRCENRRCLKALYWPDRLHDWPLLGRRGVPICGGCRDEVRQLGVRTRPRSFVVADLRTGEEYLRFPVGEGDALEVGRGALPHGINLGSDEVNTPSEVNRVSRRHLMLSVESGSVNSQVTAVDLDSANGTVLERGITSRRLKPGERIAFREKDRLVLGGAVTLRLSGQQHFSDEQQALPRLGTAGGGQTRLLTPVDIEALEI